MNADPTIARLAEMDASVDDLLRRDDGARSAFIRRRILAEAHWPTYRASYERAMEQHCATRRGLNGLRAGGCL